MEQVYGGGGVVVVLLVELLEVVDDDVVELLDVVEDEVVELVEEVVELVEEVVVGAGVVVVVDGLLPTYVTTPSTIVMYVPGTMGTGWMGAETSEETGGASNMPDGAWTIWVLVPKSERTCVPSCP